MYCKVCGKQLTNPSSIQAGYGPECAKKFQRIMEAPSSTFLIGNDFHAKIKEENKEFLGKIADRGNLIFNNKEYSSFWSKRTSDNTTEKYLLKNTKVFYTSFMEGNENLKKEFREYVESQSEETKKNHFMHSTNEKLKKEFYKSFLKKRTLNVVLDSPLNEEENIYVSSQKLSDFVSNVVSDRLIRYIQLNDSLKNKVVGMKLGIHPDNNKVAVSLFFEEEIDERTENAYQSFVQQDGISVQKGFLALDQIYSNSFNKEVAFESLSDCFYRGEQTFNNVSIQEILSKSYLEKQKIAEKMIRSAYFRFYEESDIEEDGGICISHDSLDDILKEVRNYYDKKNPEFNDFSKLSYIVHQANDPEFIEIIEDLRKDDSFYDNLQDEFNMYETDQNKKERIESWNYDPRNFL